MRKILFVAVALSLSGTALAAEPAQIYASRCQACHGKDGKGTPVGKKMGADDISKVKDSEAEIVQVITNGKGKMTAFKDKLSAEEIQAVAKYVKAGLK